MAILLNNWTGFLSFFLFALLAIPTDALPQKKVGNGGGGGGGAATAAGGPPKFSKAKDGSMIMDKTVVINGLNIRYKISAPADQFTTASGAAGGAQTANATGTAGLNVLLHGDGGQSFQDFPNQNVQNNLMGVVVLAPDPNLFWGGGSGLERTNGVAHSAAVNDLIQNQLPQDVAFDKANVFFTGVSGGSLMLSGFFVPAFGAQYKTGVELNCGALAPQVAVVDAPTMIANTRIHFQTSQDELTLLQKSIPASITAYEKLAKDNGLDAAAIGSLQTVDSTPVGGGHCGFDSKDFVSGVQLMASNYANVMSKNGTGEVKGIGNVKKTVVGNEAIKFVKGKK
ncbi:hypothetical protein HYALB_00003073 [Hymenoscyphus albidus]|uniref:Cyclin-like f-box protein n=1 Tax=Hymenoscyphus albidus TaxID=595503 RepID=A0A9N9M1R7_9HELO|nr:hypothetical protein HYALB_00003073 [Hymenoscyphus albidus]